MKDADAVFDDIERSHVMMNLWKSYQKKFSYAEEISWEDIMKSVRKVFMRTI